MITHLTLPAYFLRLDFIVSTFFTVQFVASHLWLHFPRQFALLHFCVRSLISSFEIQKKNIEKMQTINIIVDNKKN